MATRFISFFIYLIIPTIWAGSGDESPSTIKLQNDIENVKTQLHLLRIGAAKKGDFQHIGGEINEVREGSPLSIATRIKNQVTAIQSDKVPIIGDSVSIPDIFKNAVQKTKQLLREAAFKKIPFLGV